MIDSLRDTRGTTVKIGAEEATGETLRCTFIICDPKKHKLPLLHSREELRVHPLGVHFSVLTTTVKPEPGSHWVMKALLLSVGIPKKPLGDGILLSHCFCSKSPQSQFLKATQMFCLATLQVRIQNESRLN